MNMQGGAVDFAGEIDEEEISKYLLIEKTELARADAGLIFGNIHAADKLAETAAELYHRGYFPLIISSGGVKMPGSEMSESEYIAEKITRLKVPKHNILVESQSTNTPQNVILSRLLLQQSEPFYHVKRIIGMGSVVAGRRFLMTLKKSWPEVFAMAANATPPEINLKNWSKDEKSRSIIMGEFNKIAPYLAKGDLKEVDIDDINLKARSVASRPNLRQFRL